MEMSPPGKNALKMPALTIGPHTTSYHEAGIMIGGRGTQGQCYPTPSPSPDCGFESNKSLVLMVSSVSSESDRSEGSQHPCCGRCCRETGGHIKINLPIFKNEDTKDAITYQSWRWDLTAYHHAGCQDHTLLPYAI